MLTYRERYPPGTIRERHYLSPALAAMLRKGRRRKGLGLRPASRKIGIGHSYLIALETGQRAPSTAVAERLIENLGLDPGEAAWLRSEAIPDVGRSSPGRTTVW